VGEETAHKYRTTLYLSASASAEFFADILLCPWEAIKARMQTTIPSFARGTLEGWNKITSTDGISNISTEEGDLSHKVSSGSRT
jgi:solute carrier family 25 phosphate transporter 3